MKLAVSLVFSYILRFFKQLKNRCSNFPLSLRLYTRLRLICGEGSEITSRYCFLQLHIKQVKSRSGNSLLFFRIHTRLRLICEEGSEISSYSLVSLKKLYHLSK